MNTNIPLKQCSSKDQCVNPLGSWLPATMEYFIPSLSKKGGIGVRCWACKRAKEREKSLRYEAKNPEKVREIHRDYQRRFRKEHPEYMRKWREANTDHIREYYDQHPEIQRAAKVRRRALKNTLPIDFTSADMRVMLTYWHNCCAYCNSQQDFWHTIEADHFIPVTAVACPGTVKTNMLPACRSCNASKNNRTPREWMNEVFGKRRAKQILNRITLYFEWLDSDEAWALVKKTERAKQEKR